MTHVTTTIRPLTGRGKGFAADFLVDTTAVDCLAPAKALRKIGIKTEGKHVYELADGRPVELEYGFARVSLLGEETVTPIIFGPDESEPILGVLALDGLGISVDPKTRSLNREREIAEADLRVIVVEIDRSSCVCPAPRRVLIPRAPQLGVALADQRDRMVY